MRQIIIARKDLNMSPGKLAAQVAHASWAFLSNQMRTANTNDCDDETVWVAICMETSIYDEWFCGVFTKTICEAKNRNQLMKAVTIAQELGLKEGIDYFLIKDNCYTELEPEEIDANGVGRTLTCIGFKPLDDETAWKISKKFQLYK